MTVQRREKLFPLSHSHALSYSLLLQVYFYLINFPPLCHCNSQVHCVCIPKSSGKKVVCHYFNLQKNFTSYSMLIIRAIFHLHFTFVQVAWYFHSASLINSLCYASLAHFSSSSYTSSQSVCIRQLISSLFLSPSFSLHQTSRSSGFSSYAANGHSKSHSAAYDFFPGHVVTSISSFSLINNK